MISSLLTPEDSISLQNSIGSDIIMQLDDVNDVTSPDPKRVTEAMERSVRWLDRCIAAHKYPERQNLFCIVQGGLDLRLRRECCKEMVARDTPGIAIGGLSGGEAKEERCMVYALRLNFWFCENSTDTKQRQHLYKPFARKQTKIYYWYCMLKHLKSTRMRNSLF